MKITVYHGATEIIEAPLNHVGRPRLDFGQGFYVTDLKDQAIKWAKTIAEKRAAQPLLNIYTVNLYMTGFYDAESALQQLIFHKPNNQICLLNQNLINKYLVYNGTEKI